MIRFVVLGSLLGLFSAIVPGPFTALIATTAFQQGLRTGILVAVVPVLTETTVMALTAALVYRLPEQALQVMGVVGGGLVLFLAWRAFREARSPAKEADEPGSGMRVAQGVVLALLSPAPWVFWLLVGSPMFLAAWHQGWESAAVFLASFLAVFVGIYVGIAFAAAHGRKQMPKRWYRRIMFGAAGVLALAGAALIWQSWVGNFQRLVTGSQGIESRVNESLNEPGAR
jgi:threonine/homoserine/homoserine lactone efflux protein